jgi:hypothetical protein
MRGAMEREARPIEPRLRTDPEVLELEKAKEGPWPATICLGD